jgi:hypothetical protein
LERVARTLSASRADCHCARIRAALADRCSVGEMCGALRDVFGEYQPEI